MGTSAILYIIYNVVLLHIHTNILWYTYLYGKIIHVAITVNEIACHII